MLSARHCFLPFSYYVLCMCLLQCLWCLLTVFSSASCIYNFTKVFFSKSFYLHILQIAFFKQFHDSVSKSDYKALRSAFGLVRHIIYFKPCSLIYIAIEANRVLLFSQKHFPSHPSFNFYKYLIRALEHDFKRVVGIRLVFS